MTSPVRFLFKRQIWHLLALAILLPVTWMLAADALGDGSWFGITDESWFWLGTGLAILHQVFTWAGWRAQLGWELLSYLFGSYDMIFWGSVFLPLLFARPLILFATGMADRGSLALPSWLTITLGILLLIPCIYTMWSVARYFGIPRAMGGDHFRSGYRSMPYVREGAFAWSKNAMYTFGFMGLWAIALLLKSQAALSMALFQHVYIWVHHYCTEAPDAELLYDSL